MSQKDAIENFKIMAQNYKGQPLAGLIAQITKHPRVFQFTELFQIASIKNLQQGELSNYYEQLQLFAYGNYQQYIRNKGKYPEIIEEHIKKLRQLTIVDICSKNKIVSYDLLKIELNLKTDQELDDILIDSIYEGIISGKINQQEKVFKILEKPISIKYTRGQNKVLKQQQKLKSRQTFIKQGRVNDS